MISYYGGFLDSFIENFHKILGFPNGSRNYYEQNQIYIHIPTDNGITLYLDKPTMAFGDMDLWGKWTFHETRRVSLAALGAFKIPTGRLQTLSGSNYPDIGLGFLSDVRLNRFFTFYGQAGMVFPLNMKSYPMFNGLLGLELHPWKFLSFSLQMNIKTSPISNDIPWNWNGIFGTHLHAYSLPQMNILLGFIVKAGNFRWQIYFEEDAVTNQGTDLTFNLMLTHFMKIKVR
jgi:hypothetical protein